jgi:LysR family transcriptional regulator of beta-lactamase
LNALRAFEASARHLSFTRAGLELRVGQAAISQQVKSLEESLKTQLFRRLPRGLALTDEGRALVPVLSESFERIRAVLDGFENGQFRGVAILGVVGTFATGWLLPRLPDFTRAHPLVDLRLQTNNNRVDLAAEGLDFAIRFGNGSWHGAEATHLLSAPLSPLCAPHIGKRVGQPADLANEMLLRSYRSDEWPRWFAAANATCPPIKGTIFDSSVTMAEAAAQGAGFALLPVKMFERDLAEGRLTRPFDLEIAVGDYWLTSLKSKPETDAMRAFKSWLLAQVNDRSHGFTWRDSIKF